MYGHSVPEFFKRESFQFWKAYFKVILFEKDRFEKIRHILRGYLDYRKNKLGKFKKI